MKHLKTASAREAAYIAILASEREEAFASSTLDLWREKASPSADDYNLAQKIAYGTIHMKRALDCYAAQLGKMKLGRREKIILRIALYQHCFMDRIPIFAIVDQMVAIAKKKAHHSFASFLNAALRKLETANLTLPKGDTIEELSIRYSYPDFFVGKLIEQYGIETTKQILDLGNSDPRYTVLCLKGELMHGLTPLQDTPLPMAVVNEVSIIPDLARSNHFYLQNPVQATILSNLCSKLPTKPAAILDICAAPGGKTILLHKLFPDAKLYVNDISKEKIVKLEENLKKYQIPATITCSAGELLPKDRLYDLIVVDAPCSNSGVLARRAEARWRLSETAITALYDKQNAIIDHAKSLLAPEGKIIFMTCSILREENEMHQYNNVEFKILPNDLGWDGGYGALI